MKHIKHCKKCNENKPLSEYQKYIRDGINIGQAYCKDCRNKENNWSEKSNPKRMYVNGKYIPKFHPLYKGGNYKTFEHAAFDSLSRYTASSEGEVYVIRNKAWKGWIKVGMAIDAEDRCRSYQTSSPLRDYELKYSQSFKDRRTAEATAHILCETSSKERQGEWFKMPVKKAFELIENITKE